MLPPEIKIIFYLVFIVTLFLIHDITAYLFVLLIIIIIFLKIPFRSLKSGWIPISLLVFFTFISNLLFQKGKVLYHIGYFTITEEGINVALIRTMRLFFMIAGAKILTATTGIEQLVGAFGRMLRPLEHFGIPVVNFFSMVGLTMKSLPRLKGHLVETYRLKVKEDNIRGFWNRTKVVSMFLIPLIVQSLQYPEKYFKDDGKIEEKN